jgi:hypothetical protein
MSRCLGYSRESRNSSQRCGAVTFRRASRHHIVNMMQRPSRLAGLFTTLFLAAFVLVTSGFACITPSSQDMTAMGMTSTHAAAQATAQNVAPVQKAPAAPCKFPWAPDGCQSMVPCAPAALASPAATLNHGASVPERTAPYIAVAPLSVATAPELPPPRA